jgi:hypothetical protein
MKAGEIPGGGGITPLPRRKESNWATTWKQFRCFRAGEIDPTITMMGSAATGQWGNK